MLSYFSTALSSKPRDNLGLWLESGSVLARVSSLVSVSTAEDGDIMFLFETHGEPLKWVKWAYRERSSTQREKAVRQWSPKLDKILKLT